MNPEQLNNTNHGNQFTWGWIDLLIIGLGIVLLLFVGVILFVVVNVALGENLENLLEPTISQILGLTALEAVAFIAGVYIFGVRRNKLGWNSVGVRPTTISWAVISIVATLLLIPIVSLITLAILYFSGQPLENPQLDFLLPEGMSAIDAAFMLFLAGIAAPIGEELVFRGVLYTFLRERWGIWVSVFLSSFLFGLIHGNLAVGLTGFLLGVLAALVFEYSKSLWTAVMVHAINNSVKIGILYLLVLLGVAI